MIDGQCEGDCCDGHVSYFDEKGQLFLKYTHHNGERDGEGETYYPDGKIKRKFMYVKGKKNGVNYEYYPSGQVSAEGNYIDDTEAGQWVFRDSLGVVTKCVQYKSGQVVK